MSRGFFPPSVAVAASACIGLTCALDAEATQPAAAEAAAAGERNRFTSSRAGLAARAIDPTHSPLTLRLENTVTTHHYESSDGSDPGTSYQIEFQPVIPFALWELDNLLRLTLPYQVEGEGSSGLEDVEIVDLVVFDTSAGRWGAGLTTTLSARDKDVSGHISVGPALGYSVRATSFLTLGALVQSWFGDGIARSEVQPIIALHSHSGWSLSVGEMRLGYDWEDTAFTRVPLQLEIGKVLLVTGKSVRVSAGVEYNFEDSPGAERLQSKFNIELLAPE
jgi:hypothetical protein